MRAAVIAAIMILAAVITAYAEGPEPLAGRSVTAPEPLDGMSVPSSEPGQDFQGEDQQWLAEYYSQKMTTMEGVVTAIDLERRTITIKTSADEKEYVYDETTRFQIRLKPVEASQLKVGAKIAGLVRDKDGAAYIGRVVVITGVAPSKKRSRRYRRSRRRR